MVEPVIIINRSRKGKIIFGLPDEASKEKVSESANAPGEISAEEVLKDDSKNVSWSIDTSGDISSMLSLIGSIL